MPFNIGKTPERPGGEPLYAAVRRIRMELEAQMVGAGVRGERREPDPDGLHAVGLLLQLEALDLVARQRRPLELVPAANDLRPLEAPAGAQEGA